MALVFVDTGYWIAILLPGDRLYDRDFEQAGFVTLLREER